MLIGASTSALTGCRMADRPEGSAGAGGAGDGILRRSSWPGKPTSRTRLITIWT